MAAHQELLADGRFDRPRSRFCRKWTRDPRNPGSRLVCMEPRGHLGLHTADGYTWVYRIPRRVA